MSSTMAIGQTFSFNTIPFDNKHLVAAKEKAAELSKSVHNAFASAATVVDHIKPFFNALATSVRAKMDKLATKNFIQGLPFAIAFNSGGNNRTGRERKRIKKARLAESQSHKIQPV